MNNGQSIMLWKMEQKSIKIIQHQQHGMTMEIMVKRLMLRPILSLLPCEYYTIKVKIWTHVFHSSISSAVWIKCLKSIPVHCLMLSIQHITGRPLFILPSVPPCKIVFARLCFHLTTWPNHWSFLLFTTDMSRSCSPI